MTTLSLKLNGEGCIIKCGRDIWDTFSVQDGIIFTDSNVYTLCKYRLARLYPDMPVYIMPAGEEHKNEETLFGLLNAMAEAGLRRNSVLVAIGGGVVGDIGGLAASLYMRGIDCIQIPTTLLAQVDASVGGKTAIDFHGIKNLIGTFKQPKEVYVDVNFLVSLSARDYVSGWGEIVKHAALHAPLFEKVYKNKDKFFEGFEHAFLAEIIPENIAFKASVVEQDPHETGLRKSLNLGHTTAHVLELSEIDMPHGVCVLIGLIFESEIAKDYIDCDGEFLEKLKELCMFVLGELPDMAMDLSDAARLALLDKKNTEAGKVALTVPCRAGSYALLELPFDEYAQKLNEIRGRI